MIISYTVISKDINCFLVNRQAELIKLSANMKSIRAPRGTDLFPKRLLRFLPLPLSRGRVRGVTAAYTALILRSIPQALPTRTYT